MGSNPCSDRVRVSARMVRTGARATALGDLLIASGMVSTAAPPRPNLAEMSAQLADDVLALYRDLGGTQGSPALRPGGWDLSYEGGLVVELDEELHFNRYRAITLGSRWSQDLPWTTDYLDFCHAHERRCLQAGRWGKRWTNPSTARMFSGGEPGDLVGGAPRWKQRALYDTLKDTVRATGGGFRLARVSIYDEIDGVTVEDILSRADPGDARSVRGFIEARAA